jgi:hypothetical protein
MPQRQKTPNDVLQMVAAGMLLIAIFDALLRFNIHEMHECNRNYNIEFCILKQLNPIK